MKPRRAAALIVGALGAAAFVRAEPPAPRPANVILIVVDALGAGHLGTYGYSRATDPRLKAFAATGAVFLNTIAQSDWTLPSLASLMTGLYPSVHGALLPISDPNLGAQLEAGRFHPLAGQRLEPSRPTLAAILAAQGYATGAVVSGGFCNSAFGFGSGFAEYHNGGGRMEELSRTYLPWIEKNRDRRFFLYIHVGDVHDPYRAPPPFDGLWAKPYHGKQDGSRPALDALDDALAQGRPPSAEDVEHLRSLYDGGISYTDEHIGRLLDRLKALGLAENTAVIVTADHGEAFLEHGLMRHGNSFYDELLRVPLIAAFPGLKGGQRLGGQARLIDVMPTVLDYLRVPAPPTQGRSLLPWLQGAPVEDREAFSESNEGVSLRAGRWKLIRYRGRPEALYDLAGDAAERLSLRADAPAKWTALSGRLADWRAEMTRAAQTLPPLPAAGPQLDAALKEQLKAGGYLK